MANRFHIKMLYWIGELIGLLFLPGTGITLGLIWLFDRSNKMSLTTYLLMVAGFSVAFWCGFLGILL